MRVRFRDDFKFLVGGSNAPEEWLVGKVIESSTAGAVHVLLDRPRMTADGAPITSLWVNREVVEDLP